jgi:hypothetical protein
MASLILASGCSGQDKKVFTGPHRTGSIGKIGKRLVEPVYFQSEHDAFHPKSIFESNRKKSLTDFGLRTIDPPILTPTFGSVQQVVYDSIGTSVVVSSFKTGALVKPAFPFDYENDIDRLKRLYNSHKLDTIITGDMSELQKLTTLLKYTYEFLSDGAVPDPENDPGPSAELITRRMRESKISGTSRHYAALFCQLALSCGFNARMVGMHAVSDTGEILTHDVVEVYMNRYSKWVVFDAASRATYYTRSGIPQSALELRNIMLDQNYRALQVFSMFGNFTDVTTVKEKLLQRYRYIYIWRMNDILSMSPQNGSISWEDLYRTHLVWEDDRALVRDGNFENVPAFKNSGGVKYVAHDKNDFYWPLNYVILHIVPKKEYEIDSYFTTMTPNFKTYRIEDDTIFETTKNYHKLELILNTYEVTSINAFGLPGLDSYVDIIR